MHSRSIEINSHITVLFVSLNERKLSKRASAFFFCAKYTLEGVHTRFIEINSHITVLFVSLNKRELSKRASAFFFLFFCVK